MTTHTQAAPATAYALAELATTTDTQVSAAVLLAAAALADRDLYGSNGYRGNSPREVAAVINVTPMTAQRVMVGMNRTNRLTLADPADMGHIVPDTLFRIPQVAFDRSNGEEPEADDDGVVNTWPTHSKADGDWCRWSCTAYSGPERACPADCPDSTPED